MDTSLISKIHKAKQYSEDRTRFSFQSFQVGFQGKHGPHIVTFAAGDWSCDCAFFDHRGYCSHTMALERLLDGMLAEPGSEDESGAESGPKESAAEAPTEVAVEE